MREEIFSSKIILFLNDKYYMKERYKEKSEI